MLLAIVLEVEVLYLVLHFYVLVKAKHDLSYFYNIDQQQQIYFTSKEIARNNKNEKEKGNI